VLSEVNMMSKSYKKSANRVQDNFKKNAVDVTDNHRLTNLSGIDSGGCIVIPPGLRPLRTCFTLSALQPSSSSNRCSRSSVKSTATNSTVANFLPEHAREPSEKGKNVPLPGLSIPGLSIPCEDAIDERRDPVGLGTERRCCCAANGVRKEELGVEGILESFSCG